MPAVSLILMLGFLAAVFGLRAVIQRRRTGGTGWVDPSQKPRVERLADALFVLAAALVLCAPVLELLGAVEAVGAFEGVLPQALGIVLMVAATAYALASQAAMGDAWRTGVGSVPSTRLVVSGPFARVRNPFYTAVLGAALGAALLSPTAVAIAGAAGFLAALELQVRAVEEPHLQAEHGERYRAYAARAGRFVPGVGRLR